MKRTSLTEKMILYFLALGIVSIVVTGSFSFFAAREALLRRTYDQLTSLKLARQVMIERYFSDRLSETLIYASSEEATLLAKKLLPGSFAGNNMLSESKGHSFHASGYYSGFLISDKSGKILYTDSLTTFAGASWSEKFLIYPESARQEPFIIDYPAVSHHTENRLLVVSPIIIKGEVIAYLAMILKPGQVENFMLEVDPENGLGNSGETYLVGPDYLMRSQSRFIRNSIMKTRVLTLPVLNAFKYEKGIVQAADYRNIEVLSSYGRIKAKGLNWVILAELDYKEATSSIYTIRNNILLLTVFTGLVFFIITYIISNRITRPIMKLKKAALELGEGRLNSPVVIESDDEIGELTETFNSMALTLQEKDKSLKIERRNRLRSAIDGQDQERQRLSRELHDGIGQSMIAIRLRLAAQEAELPGKFKQNFQATLSLTDSLIDEIRAISNALMPPSLAEFGLATAIHNLCNSLTETYGIQTRVEGEIPGMLLSKKARLYVFRIFQEALNNAAKHSEATTISIIAKQENSFLNTWIIDNGKGFDQHSGCAGKGHGLNNIMERANLLRGQAIITSAPGAGTSVHISIPLNKTEL